MCKNSVSLFSMVLSLLALLDPSYAKEPGMQINPDLLKKRWPASWVAHPDGPHHDYGVFHFRRRFVLEQKPQRFVVHVSADNRYRLFVNGRSVCWGPARGDLWHWRFETVDLASFLRQGENVVAAVVWNFGDYLPWAQMTHRTGFLLQGDTDAERVLDTRPGNGWLVCRDPAYAPIPVNRAEVPFFSVVGPGDSVDASKYPWGWQSLEFDDSDWSGVISVSRATPRAIRDGGSVWMLVPRTIPPMEESLQRFQGVVRSQGIEVPSGFVQGDQPLHVPARSRVSILFNQGQLTTAYPELVVFGGKGSRIRLTYAEALWKGREKGNRNEVEGKQMLGYHDEFVLDGGSNRDFRTLWWRTFRYLQMDIQTADEPLVIQDFKSWYTGYPFEEKAQFSSSDTSLKRIWDVGWHTARLCAQETYTDCPYYEQLQYVGDTRVQALISLYVSGDDRLVRKAIRQFDDSRIPDGLTASRYPSYVPQIIPPFSLWWVNMVHDYWWHRDDPEFVRSLLPGIHSVLSWFLQRLDPRTGILGPLEWWNFVDWSREYRGGVPPGTEEGGSAIVSLQLVWALQDAAELEEALGDGEQARKYARAAREIAAATLRGCWDSERQLLANSPKKTMLSQHANILGVLTDAIPKEKQRDVVERILSDSSLVQATFYFRFYLHWAVRKVGLADRYLDLLEPWRQMLRMGLTTWAEAPEPTRSDCHAWSAHPNIDLLRTVCGIQAGSPGFRTVRVEPYLGPLGWVEGRVPHPKGDIDVHLQRTEAGGLRAQVTLPPGLTGELVWRGESRPLAPGEQVVEF